MRQFLLSLAIAAALFLPVGLHAQQPKALDPVAVGIAFNTGSYVIGEDIPVRLLVRNNTTGEMTLGRGGMPTGVLDVARVNDPQRVSLARDPLGCLPRPLTLAPGEQRVFDVNLTRVANLTEQGKYFVTFGVIFGGLRYDTQVKVVEIVPGTIVSEGTQLFTRAPGRQRRFTLVRWPRDHIDRLFLRVADTPDGRFFPTVMLGAYLPLMRPRLNIADNGEVTVLHRATPDYYVRNVFWSLPNEFVRRSTLNLLDPNTADTQRLNAMREDLDEVIQKNDRLKESLRLR